MKFEFHADLKSLTEQFKRIADALDRAYPPRRVSPEPDAVLIQSNMESEWEREQKERQEQGS